MLCTVRWREEDVWVRWAMPRASLHASNAFSEEIPVESQAPWYCFGEQIDAEWKSMRTSTFRKCSQNPGFSKCFSNKSWVL